MPKQSICVVINDRFKLKQFSNIRQTPNRINPCQGIIDHKNPYNSNLPLLCNNRQTAEGRISEKPVLYNHMFHHNSIL